MIFNIEYYREGRLLSSQPWKAASLQDAIAHAKSQMVIHRADFARIIDVDGSGAEVWSGRNDA
jgi:hypothetical protein